MSTKTGKLHFKTATHDHQQDEAIWIITQYKPNNFQIEYLRIEPEVKVGKIHIECGRNGDKETQATITYTYTGLSELGNQFVETLTAEHYHAFILVWEQAINEYLQTGRTLLVSHHG